MAEGEKKPAGQTSLQYVGTADVREMSAADWRAAGVDGLSMTRWTPETDWVVDVPKEAAAKLMEAAPGEFQEVAATS